MIRKRLRALLDGLSFALVKCSLFVVSLLPPGAAYALARVLGSAAYAVGRRRRGMALRNLDIAFRSSLSDREKRRIARASFQHALASVASFALRDRHTPQSSLERLFTISKEEEKLLLDPHPEGLLLLSAHTGDWEMAHHYCAVRGVPVAVVTRGISNRWLHREVLRRRSRRGARSIDKRGALAAVRATLRNGQVAGLLADQNCPDRARFFDFFGIPASTYTSYSRILARSSARILFIACLRDGFRFRFRIIVRDLGLDLPPLAAGRGAESVAWRADEIVRRYLAAAEALIREHPEQHLWIHRRWKSRPDGAPWLYHDLGKPLDPSFLGPRAA